MAILSGASSVATEILKGCVKWYDGVKGYGFVAVDDGGGDVLLHANCLRRSNVSEAPEGASITLEAVEGERGRQAVAILEMGDDPAITADPLPTQVAEVTQDASDWMPARIKWFDRAKGFGFLNIFGDKADVFVHMETLRLAGITRLDAGEALATKIVAGPRGKMSSEVCQWESVETEQPSA